MKMLDLLQIHVDPRVKRRGTLSVGLCRKLLGYVSLCGISLVSTAALWVIFPIKHVFKNADFLLFGAKRSKIIFCALLAAFCSPHCNDEGLSEESLINLSRKENRRLKCR